MKTYDVHAVSSGAVSARPDRPATALMHDTPDVRLVVFRIEPGQQVAPHTSSSTVVLSILSGTGVVSDGERDYSVRAGAVVAYMPNEPHGMRALDDPLVILATIAPRPAAVAPGGLHR
jgi:quercetin dioxygenase-like cupin family protein